NERRDNADPEPYGKPIRHRLHEYARPEKLTSRAHTGSDHSASGKGAYPERVAASRSSEGQIGAELHHAAVLDQRWLKPQRTVVEVFNLNGTAIQDVVQVEITRQPNPLCQLHALA